MKYICVFSCALFAMDQQEINVQLISADGNTIMAFAPQEVAYSTYLGHMQGLVQTELTAKQLWLFKSLVSICAQDFSEEQKREAIRILFEAPEYSQRRWTRAHIMNLGPNIFLDADTIDFFSIVYDWGLPLFMLKELHYALVVSIHKSISNYGSYLGRSREIVFEDRALTARNTRLIEDIYNMYFLVFNKRMRMNFTYNTRALTQSIGIPLTIEGAYEPHYAVADRYRYRKTDTEDEFQIKSFSDLMAYCTIMMLNKIAPDGMGQLGGIFRGARS